MLQKVVGEMTQVWCHKDREARLRIVCWTCMPAAHSYMTNCIQKAEACVCSTHAVAALYRRLQNSQHDLCALWWIKANHCQRSLTYTSKHLQWWGSATLQACSLALCGAAKQMPSKLKSKSVWAGGLEPNYWRAVLDWLAHISDYC